MRRTAPPSPDTETVPDIKLDAVYPHPPERVWRALTDPRQLAQWLLPNDFAPHLGHRFTFRDRRGPPIHCEVIVLEEARRLAYTWRRGPEEPLSVVTWTLEPVSDGATRVRLTHSRPRAFRSIADAWRTPLQRLPHVLNPALRIPLFIAPPRTSLWRSPL